MGFAMPTAQKQSVPVSVTLLRRAEVVEALNVSVWTLDRWIRQGLFPAPLFLTPTSNVAVWRLRDVENFLEKRRRARRVKRRRGMLRPRRRGHDDDHARRHARGGDDAQ
jgi:predicted DNA-binding transcriptional regulator AlpA